MKIACIVIIFFSALSAISTNPAYNDHCKLNGGQIIEMTAQFDTSAGFINGNKRQFCRIQNQAGNLGYIGLDTFAAKEPSLAATYAKSIVVEQSKVISGPFGTNNLNLCYALGGGNIIYFLMDGGFTDNYDQVDICVFGDESTVAGWTLFYMGIGDRTDIKTNIVAEPLLIPLPAISYSN